ncbi:MAG TPA: NAD(P)-dependent alcohol dehydrogenase [Gemmatimonadaceae bacterium]|nr:NAD(P)-dependent alcohol dehydrogenase [Gemmatimonadaceae bacterium]
MSPKRALKWAAAAIPLALLLVLLVAYWRSDNACGEPRATAPRVPMKAVIYCDYGGPEVLRIENVEKPVPNDDEVLVRVRAVAVNPLDWHFMRGTPYLGRMEMGLRRPKSTRLGVDFAGTVEAVGRNVTRFKPGDAVFGGRNGAFAEYVVVRADRNVVLEPTNATFEQAAAIPIAGVTALQAVRDQGGVRAGQTVLVNGASGGVGTFAVQIAKSLGANVTGVSSTKNVDMVRSIGAARVIDYTHDDFTRDPERYDVVIDNVGNHSLSDLRHVMKTGGRYVMVGGPPGRWVDPLPRAASTYLYSKLTGQDMRFFLAALNPKDLTVLRDLVQAGKVTPVIDRRYPFGELPEAIRYLETGRARGKVVVTME